MSAKVINVAAVWKHVSWTISPTPAANYFEWGPEEGTPSNVIRRSLRWRFITADGAVQDVSSRCDMMGTGCNLQIQESGTVEVDVQVNGQDKTLKQYVHVGPATLSMQPNRSDVFPDDTVIFTAQVRPDSTAAQQVTWWWKTSGTSDSTRVCLAATLVCPFSVPRAGAMTVHAQLNGRDTSITKPITLKSLQLSLRPSEPEVDPGDTVRFQTLVNGDTALLSKIRILDWYWENENSGGSSTSALMAPPATSSADGTTPDEIEASEDGISPDASVPNTVACAHQDTHCTTTMWRIGKMWVEAEVRATGERLRASAPAAAGYICPPSFVKDPLVIQATKRTVIGSRASLAPAQTTLFGDPYNISMFGGLLEIRTQDGIKKGGYEPSGGYDEFGNQVVGPRSTVWWQCFYFKKKGTSYFALASRMEYDNHADIVLVAVTNPPR